MCPLAVTRDICSGAASTLQIAPANDSSAILRGEAHEGGCEVVGPTAEGLIRTGRPGRPFHVRLE
ncbi:hypothetical protein [Bradyrhizobium sp. USDA 4452]